MKHNLLTILASLLFLPFVSQTQQAIHQANNKPPHPTGFSKIATNNFERFLFGDTMHLLSNRKWQPVNKKHEDIYELTRIIDSLNRNLKAVGIKRGLRADSLRAELLFTLGITHWLRGEFDTGSVFKSEYLPLKPVSWSLPIIF